MVFHGLSPIATGGIRGAEGGLHTRSPPKMNCTHLSAIFVTVLALAGCKNAEKSETTTTSAPTSNTPAAAQPKAAAAPASSTKDVSLAPLPLKIVMPSSETAETMDKSMDDHKSVGVSYDAIFAGINVAEPREKNFDAVKKSVKGDTVMFPFKKWVKDEPKQVIAEFSDGGKTGYLAYAWREVGGKPYVCQSAGMAGLKTVEDAEKVLKVCDSLAAK
jgi:outer membrane murein-binding lipoprotein Lpp